MSRIGKKSISIPSDVFIEQSGSTVKVKGPKGELAVNVKGKFKITIESGKVVVENIGDSSQGALHGLYRSLIQNMVWGVTKGWTKSLEMIGVGYRAAVTGATLTLNVGFSHQVDFVLPAGVTAEVKENKINIQGIDKQQVGEVAAKVRRVRPPEPYKGKGIRYVGEVVRRKAGKTAKGAAGVTGK